LLDFAHLVERLECEDVNSLIVDFRAALAATPSSDFFRTWLAFFEAHREVFEKSSWPAHKILVQLAAEHGDDSFVSAAADKWLASGVCDFVWLRREPRAASPPGRECLWTLNHKGNVNDTLELRDGRLVSWTDWSSRVRQISVWDPSTGRRLALFKGHTSTIRGVFRSGNFLVSYDADAVYVWDLRTLKRAHKLVPGINITVHRASVNGGMVSAWTRYTNDRWTWDVASGRLKKKGRSTPPEDRDRRRTDLRKVCSGREPRTYLSEWRERRSERILRSGQVVTWYRDKIRVWDPSQFGAEPKHVRFGEWATMPLPGGRLLAFSGFERYVFDCSSSAHQRLQGDIPGYVEGGVVRCWDTRTGTLRTSSGEQGRSGSVPLTSNGRVQWQVKETGDQGFRDEVWTEFLFEVGAYRDECQTDGYATIHGAAMLSDRRVAYWEGDTLQVRNLHSKKHWWQRHPGDQPRIFGVLAVSPTRFVTWASDCSLAVWDEKSTSVTRLGRHPDVVAGAAVHEDHLLTWSRDGAMRWWDIDKMCCLARCEAKAVAARKPEWLDCRQSTDPCFEPQYGFFARGNRGPDALKKGSPPQVALNHVRKRSVPTAVWVSGEGTEPRRVLADGTLVAALADGQLVFLKLYRGNERIGLADLD
jgi:WD40 repeat protein